MTDTARIAPPRRRLSRASMRFCAASAASLLAAAPVLAQTPVTAAEVERYIPRIERYIEQSMAAWQVPGLAIGIVAEDRLVYAKGFGVRRYGGNEPVTPRTVFQFGSATKALLGATLAILVDDGKLAWADKVIDHYPGFRLHDPWVTREFEIGDLLAQRSGLPAYALTDMMMYGYPREAVIHGLRFVDPETSFRSSFAYQNAFHVVAGKVVASLGGTRNWEAFLRSRLLTPLGMTSSSNTVEEYEAAPEWARGHRLEAGAVTVDPNGPFPYIAGGAGNLNTNVVDVSRWLRMQINGGELDGTRIVSRHALEATHMPRIAVTGALKPLLSFGEFDSPSYATGWVVHATPQGRIIEHSGGTIGHVSNAAFDPDRKVGVVILTNISVNVGAGLAIPVAKFVMDLIQRREPADYAELDLQRALEAEKARQEKLRPPADPLQHRPLPEYAGAYASPTLGRIEIQPGSNGKLGFTLGPAGAVAELEPWSGDTFVMSLAVPANGPDGMVVRAKVRFLTNPEDEITGLEWPGESDSAGQPVFQRVRNEG